MLRVFVLTMALLFAVASAQSTFPPLQPATPGSVREVLDSSITLNICRLQLTTTLLGYSPTTGQAIYRNRCTGLCLSSIAAPNECVAQQTMITVSSSSNPQVPGVLSVVQQTTSCSCRPRRCRVRVDNQDIFYNHGTIAYDACNRRCTCNYGTLTNCCRQRKEFRLGLSTVEKERYLNAVKTVSTNPLYKPQYDALIQKHLSLFNSGIHVSALFLPWHREYIWDLENLLQRVDCRVTVPYWRWSLEAANPFASTIWANSASGFGGNGVPGGNCIGGGPFAPPWQTSQVPPQCLRRNFITTATFATEAQITQALDVTCPASTQYDCMRGQLESFHNYVHVAIGGQMGGGNSANDPIFFMHHTYIDRLWARWQDKSPAHVTAYTGANVAMPGSTYVPSAFLDLTRQQNNASNRVCYINPPNVLWLDSVLAIPSAAALSQPTCPTDALFRPISEVNFSPINPPCLTASRLQYLPRVAPNPFPLSWFREMKMNDTAIAAEQAIHNSLNDPKLYNLLTRDQAINTTGITSEIGFYLYDEDYACVSRQLQAVSYAKGEDEYPPYSPTN